MPRLASLIAAAPSHFLCNKNKRAFRRLSWKRGRLFSSSKSSSAMKVAVIGSGMSGAVCAASLAEKGVSVTVFESGRGPGGRTSQRREITRDGKELLFDHGAPFFTVDDGEMMNLVSTWEARGLVAEWKASFGCFDQTDAKFIDLEKEGSTKKYVGVPGMNSVCKALCLESGVEATFGTTVGKLEWFEGRSFWALTSLEGQNLGHFDAVVATDKNIASPRFTGVTGHSPPLDLNVSPEISVKLQEVPVRSCFALMLAFSEPLLSIPVKGFSFGDSSVLSWAFCDSSKPGRLSDSGECWVLHSTDKYAKGIISRTGLEKPSNDTLVKVAQELFEAFESTGLHIPQPFFMKAHRWGSAFPTIAVAGREKCLWDRNKRLAICGDFCVSPSIEGAVLSGKQAAENLLEILSCS